MQVKNPKPVIAGFGEILWDLLPSGKQLGGAPANFVYHAAALGAEAYPVSCVGEDGLGTEIREFLDKKALPGKYICGDPEHPTGTVSVNLDKKGVPSYIIHEQVAWDFIPWSVQIAELAPSLDAVCFGSLAQRSETSRNTLRRFLASLSPHCLKIFDINLRQNYFSSGIIAESLQNTDILKLNGDELEVVSELLETGGSVSERLLKLIGRYSLKLIALTRGEQGSLLVTSGELSEIASYPVEITDTVGAGDAFTAALAVGWLNHEPLSLIHHQANRLAGYVCSRQGAMPPVDASVLF